MLLSELWHRLLYTSEDFLGNPRVHWLRFWHYPNLQCPWRERWVFCLTPFARGTYFGKPFPWSCCKVEWGATVARWVCSRCWKIAWSWYRCIWLIFRWFWSCKFWTPLRTWSCRGEARDQTEGRSIFVRWSCSEPWTGSCLFHLISWRFRMTSSHLCTWLFQ